MNGSSTPSKIFLVADRRAGAQGADGTPIRRFRIARLSPERRPIQGGTRFEYLRRTHD